MGWVLDIFYDIKEDDNVEYLDPELYTYHEDALRHMEKTREYLLYYLGYETWKLRDELKA